MMSGMDEKMLVHMVFLMNGGFFLWNSSKDRARAREHFRRLCAAVREYVVGAAAIARRAYTAQAVGTDAAR